MRTLSKTLRLLSSAAPSVAAKTVPRVTAVGIQHCLLSQLAGKTSQLTCSQLKTIQRLNQLRSYAEGKQLTIPEIQERVLNICKAYDKITADKLSLESHFMNDLGLDSLDHVEVIMAMEDEFGESTITGKVTPKIFIESPIGNRTYDWLKVRFNGLKRFEIPDADAERLLRPADIVRYVADHEEIYE